MKLQLVHGGHQAGQVDDNEPTLAQFARELGIDPGKPIDTAACRMHSWSLASTSGSNILRVGEVIYSWDSRPRRQQNGALIGRVYAQRRGESPRDIGGYKIEPDGRVSRAPAELAGVLPGAENAAHDPQPDAGEETP